MNHAIESRMSRFRFSQAARGAAEEEAEDAAEGEAESEYGSSEGPLETSAEPLICLVVLYIILSFVYFYF